MIFVIDNYDSFTYNLVQYIGSLGGEPKVARADAFSLAELDDPAISGLVISPGPGRPEDAGQSIAAIRRVAGRIPVLGVCLGHQAIGAAFGGVIERAPVPMHGKVSAIYHDGAGVLAGLPSPFTATRYHSLMVARGAWPEDLLVTAWTEDGLVMGLRHRRWPIEGVQFHPESCLSEHGHALVEHFVRRCMGDDPRGDRTARVGTPPDVRAGQ